MLRLLKTTSGRIVGCFFKPLTSAHFFFLSFQQQIKWSLYCLSKVKIVIWGFFCIPTKFFNTVMPSKNHLSHPCSLFFKTSTIAYFFFHDDQHQVIIILVKLGKNSNLRKFIIINKTVLNFFVFLTTCYTFWNHLRHGC